MKFTLTFVALATFIATPVSVFGQDAQSVLDEMTARDAARKEAVLLYSVTQSVMDQEVTHYYERTEVTLDDGSSANVYRAVPPAEMQKRSGQGGQQLTPEQAEAYANALEQTGDTVSTEMENGLEDAGLPRSLFSSMGSPSEPWASPDPRTMMGSSAKFVRAAGKAGAQTDTSHDNATELANHMASFRDTAKLIGKESIDGRSAFHLKTSDINQTQEADGQEFTIQTLNFWVDTSEYVPLKMRMEGIAKVDGETRPIFVEQYWADYRNIADSDMYESFLQTMRMGGVLGPKEQAQMAEAQKQMAEFEKQLASMPASQRQMMEKMMGSKMDMMRSMVTGGAFEIKTTVSGISIIQ